jgi:hypothetical protein
MLCVAKSLVLGSLANPLSTLCNQLLAGSDTFDNTMRRQPPHCAPTIRITRSTLSLLTTDPSHSSPPSLLLDPPADTIALLSAHVDMDTKEDGASKTRRDWQDLLADNPRETGTIENASGENNCQGPSDESEEG